MAPIERMVDRAEWMLASGLGPRRERLLDVPGAGELMTSVATEVLAAAARNDVALGWQESSASPGHFRLVANAPLGEVTFDQFFSGRSGYRAQYYLSPEEGVLFNRAVLSRIVPALRVAYETASLEASWVLVERSMAAPHSKIWVFNELEAFNDAAPNTVNPSRWVENNSVMGRRAPLPTQRRLDIKGAFIHPASGALFIDDLKLERPLDIFRRGFS